MHEQLMLMSRRSQDWFHKLDHEAKAEYKKRYPGTRFIEKTHLKAAPKR